jgi:hypothetical protein
MCETWLTQCLHALQWSTVEPGIGITAGSIACLRPLVRVWLWRLGLAAPPRDRRTRTYYPSRCERRRKDPRGYRRSLSPSDLVPTGTYCTTSTEIFGPKKEEREAHATTPTIVLTEPEPDMVSNEIMQTVTVNQAFEHPPRLELRDSLRNSFTRGTILSLGKFRIPT